MLRLPIYPLAFSAIATLLVGCTPSETINPAAATIDGYNGLTFGMSFTDVIGKMGHEQFNVAGVKDCFENMATQGCFLSRAEDTTYFDMQEGIPYAPQLVFSKFDKLFDISLVYNREGPIQRGECLDVYERSLDWVQAKYGAMSVPAGRKDQSTNRTTPQGISYKLDTGEDGFFNSSAQHNFTSSREVSVMGTFIVVDRKPMCMVEVSFTDDSLGSVLTKGRIPK